MTISNDTIIKAAYQNLDDIGKLRRIGEHALRTGDTRLYGIVLWAIKQNQPMAAFNSALVPEGGAA
jgi:hypothetical protein